VDSEAGGISYEAASASEISYDATPVVQAGAGVEASARPFSLPLARSWILVAPLKALIAPPVDVAVQQPGNIQASSAPALEGEGFLLLDRENWALLNRVNRMVNRRIRQASDQSVFGQADYWQAPVGDGAYGDCEDYVLAKRQALIEAGVPEAALSIAIVETRWGESHAVLLVTGETGEVVLDSLSSWISRWDRVDYVWRERQAPGKVFEWVTIAT
jgi:predicted transglutaminase-like cysteine proteinase